MDYRATLNLPQTDFPMKAGLAQKEPGWLEKWGQMELYQKILDNFDQLGIHQLVLTMNSQ